MKTTDLNFMALMSSIVKMGSILARISITPGARIPKVRQLHLRIYN